MSGSSQDSGSNVSRSIIVVDAQVGFINEHTDTVPGTLANIFGSAAFEQAIFTRFINTENSLFKKVLSWHRLSSQEEIAIVRDLRKHATSTIDKFTYVPDMTLITKLLNAKPAQELLVAGIDTDVCVLLTAAALFDAGYPVKVLADACRSTGGPLLHEAALDILPRIIGSQNVIEDSAGYLKGRRRHP